MIPTLIGGIASQLVFNAATGGTETTFTDAGKTYKRHTFLSNGTFTISRAVKPFRVAVLGGGGGGGAHADGFGSASGSAGGWHAADTTLSVGALTVTIGQGGNGACCIQIGGGTGLTGGQGGNSSLQGSFVGGGGSGGAGGPSAPQGTPGTGNPSPSANGGVTTPDRATYGIASNRGAGGLGALGTYLEPIRNAGENGTAGAVVIQYEIAG